MRWGGCDLVSCPLLCGFTAPLCSHPRALAWPERDSTLLTALLPSHWVQESSARSVFHPSLRTHWESEPVPGALPSRPPQDSHLPPWKLLLLKHSLSGGTDRVRQGLDDGGASGLSLQGALSLWSGCPQAKESVRERSGVRPFCPVTFRNVSTFPPFSDLSAGEQGFTTAPKKGIHHQS